MARHVPKLSEVWPFDDTVVPAEIAAWRITAFLQEPADNAAKSVAWALVSTVDVVPRASYALQVRVKARCGHVARWDSAKQRWREVAEFAVDETLPETISIVEFKGVLLANVMNAEQLSARVSALLQKTRQRTRDFLLASRLVSILSIVTLFGAIRLGVESFAPEAFVLLFALALMTGLLGLAMRLTAKQLAVHAIAKLAAQFRFEYDPKSTAAFTVADVTRPIRAYERQQEERATVFGFLLLLGFAYIVSPLVVLGVIAALFVAIIGLDGVQVEQTLVQVQSRAAMALENALLSFRSGFDRMSPRRLRQAKSRVLREGLRRYETVSNHVARRQSRAALRQDGLQALVTVIIFGAYILPMAFRVEAGSAAAATPVFSAALGTASIFSVAPIIVLYSLSKATVSTASIIRSWLPRLQTAS